MTRYRLRIETADGAVLEDVMPAENARQACDEAAADHPGLLLVTKTDRAAPSRRRAAHRNPKTIWRQA